MSFMMGLQVFGAFTSLMGASQAAAARRRQAEREEFQGEVALLQGLQQHNDRVEDYRGWANEYRSAVAFNNRAASDRSAQAIAKAAKKASRRGLSRIATQTLFTAGRYRAAAAESRSAAQGIMLGGFANTAANLASGLYKYQQVTPTSTAATTVGTAPAAPIVPPGM